VLRRRKPAQGHAHPPWRYVYWGSVYLPVIKAQNPTDPSAAGLPMATVWYVPPPLIPFHLPVPERKVHAPGLSGASTYSPMKVSPAWLDEIPAMAAEWRAAQAASRAMKQPATQFHHIAEQQGIPLRTLEQVRETLENAKLYDADREMALLMLRHGRLTDEAREYVARR
jgi:hypothetical protein